MKLKKHREDVAYLKGCTIFDTDDVRVIADRYHRLILMAEEADRLYYRGIYTTKVKRVLKDAETGK